MAPRGEVTLHSQDIELGGRVKRCYRYIGHVRGSMFFFL